MSQERLEELGYSGTGFFWSQKYAERAKEMQGSYGSVIDVFVQYVWQGGARDLATFKDEFQEEFKAMRGTCEREGSPLMYEDPWEHYVGVRDAMADVALDEEDEFLSCPFMKVRMRNLASSGAVDARVIRDVLCYVANGTRLDEFKMDEGMREAREGYLRWAGILTSPPEVS